jgi:putative ABC transport system permease protein
MRLFQGERKAEGEAKVSLVLSILSALLLLTGYYMAATAQAASVGRVMFPVVVITVAGTYLFYTQLSIYMVKLLKMIRRLYWNHTNIITLSGLSYRWKENARMFFMVTIVSAVSFTSVGVFASIHTLSRELKLDYPAAVGYVAKGNQTQVPFDQHLGEIKEELTTLGIPYETLSIPIKYAEVESQTGPDRTLRLPLMAYSDYKLALLRAGFTTDERPLSGDEGLVMIGSQRDRSLIEGRVKSVYTLKQGLSIRETGYTQHVPIAEYLLPELDGRDGGDFSGVVISDALYKAIAPVQTDLYTGFYMDDFPQTVGIAADLAHKGKRAYERNSPYAIVVSGTLFEIQKTLYNTMLFASLLVGTVFFIAAGSFLYFRLYTDLDHDRHQYSTLSKMGLTDQELNRIVTTQLSLLFFVPVGVAILHSVFAFIALQRLFYLSIAVETGAVLSGYLAVQGLYFLFIRSRYLRNLKKNLI